LSVRLVTHTPCGPAAKDVGASCPVAIRVTRFVAASIRNAFLPTSEPTQSVPAAKRMFAGWPPVRMRRTTRFVRGEMR
jgi:hypothetical protein